MKKENSLCSSQCGRQLATEIDDLEPLKWKGARGQCNEVMDELLFSASNSLQTTVHLKCNGTKGKAASIFALTREPRLDSLAPKKFRQVFHRMDYKLMFGFNMETKVFLKSYSNYDVEEKGAARFHHCLLDFSYHDRREISL